jgi:hypothetical protein
VETRIVPGPAGDAVNGFAASRAGLVLADEENGLADQLARLTGKGVVWVSPENHKDKYINALYVQLAANGMIAYESDFDEPGPAINRGYISERG